MPIYSYVCVTPKTDKKEQPCNHEYDVLYTSFAAAEREEAEEACPSCGGKEKVRKLPQGTSHILKGKGWARDNYS